jgi:hypothetical protein
LHDEEVLSTYAKSCSKETVDLGEAFFFFPWFFFFSEKSSFLFLFVLPVSIVLFVPLFSHDLVVFWISFCPLIH